MWPHCDTNWLFYGDGKDYRVLNLEEGSDDSFRHRYLVTALLASHEQQFLFADHETELQPNSIERPLWMSVGSSVTKKPSKDDRTDVVNILLFLARFVREREESVGILERLMSGRTNLNYKGCDLFADSFNYLMEKDLTIGQIPARYPNSLVYSHAASEEDATQKVTDADFLPFGSINLTYMLS